MTTPTPPTDRPDDVDETYVETNTQEHARHEQADPEGTHLSVPLAEERLEPRIVETERGHVRLHKRVETTPVSQPLTLEHGDVEIERLTRDEPVSERQEPWYEGDVLMIPLYEEVPVTTTQLVLREVVAVRHTIRTEDVTVEGETRREVIEIERTGDA